MNSLLSSFECAFVSPSAGCASLLTAAATLSSKGLLRSCCLRPPSFDRRLRACGCAGAHLLCFCYCELKVLGRLIGWIFLCGCLETEQLGDSFIFSKLLTIWHIISWCLSYSYFGGSKFVITFLFIAVRFSKYSFCCGGQSFGCFQNSSFFLSCQAAVHAH